MLIERTIIDQIELCFDGVVRIRFAIQILRDGEVVDSKWHRTAIPQEIPAEAQLQFVQDHFKLQGIPPFDPAEIQRVKEVCLLNQSQWSRDNARLQAIANSGKQGGKGPVV